MVAGKSTLEPRMASVPVRLPLPPAESQGSIYENQRSLRSRFFEPPKQAGERERRQPAAAGASAAL
jgi:hypothetical protein